MVSWLPLYSVVGSWLPLYGKFNCNDDDDDGGGESGGGDMFVGLLLAWFFGVPAACKRISGTICMIRGFQTRMVYFKHDM